MVYTALISLAVRAITPMVFEMAMVAVTHAVSN